MRLKELYEQYHDRVEFIVVYVKEAHASDRWWLGRSRTQRLVNDLTGQLARTDVKEPVTLEQPRSRGKHQFRRVKFAAAANLAAPRSRSNCAAFAAESTGESGSFAAPRPSATSR